MSCVSLSLMWEIWSFSLVIRGRFAVLSLCDLSMVCVLTVTAMVTINGEKLLPVLRFIPLRIKWMLIAMYSPYVVWHHIKWVHNDCGYWGDFQRNSWNKSTQTGSRTSNGRSFSTSLKKHVTVTWFLYPELTAVERFSVWSVLKCCTKTEDI